MTEAPEFSHTVNLSGIGSRPRQGSLAANEQERDALALRFDLPKISSLTATYELVEAERGIAFTGWLTATLHQNCAVTGEAFPVRVNEQFDILFVPKADPGEVAEEIELTEEECDLIEYDHARVDLGEAVAQTLYLALDPYPRGPNADAVAREKGLKTEEEAGPFGALSALKDKLG